MNVGGVDYGLNAVYIDVMKHSSNFTSVPAADIAGTSLGATESQYVWGDGQEVLQSAGGEVLDLQRAALTGASRKNGGKRVPTQEVVALALRDLCLRGTDGVYVVLYDGEGFLDFGMDAEVLSRRKGRIELQVTLTCDPSCWFDTGGWRPYCTDNGLYIRWVETNPLDPIRNVRVIMPGMERRAQSSEAPFNPAFLKTLERFGTLRFMDLMRTNGNGGLVEWSQRPVPSDRSAAAPMRGHLGGMSVEHLVLLANSLGARPWFCMPHAASDDFVRKFAELVLATLRPDVGVVLEYSNEVSARTHHRARPLVREIVIL
jgi:hypothetical protein